MNINIGDKALITCNDWFFGPNGQQYKAVFGTVKAVRTSEETLGVKTNARSTNWYVEIGNTTVAGCQIHYVVKTDEVNFGMPEHDAIHEGRAMITKTLSRIYNADEGGN